jgi:hypothetical protein
MLPPLTLGAQLHKSRPPNRTERSSVDFKKAFIYQTPSKNLHG